MKMRGGDRARLRQLRKEYRRERGRHDRCWDGIYIGRRAIINAMREAMDHSLRELRRSMSFCLWGNDGTRPEPPVRYLGPGKGYE